MRSEDKLKFTLQDFNDIVGALGGVKETARITGRTPAQVCQWRQRYGKFPPEHYITISNALISRGFGAPTHLFKFERPNGE